MLDSCSVYIPTHSCLPVWFWCKSKALPCHPFILTSMDKYPSRINMGSHSSLSPQLDLPIICPTAENNENTPQTWVQSTSKQQGKLVKCSHSLFHLPIDGSTQALPSAFCYTHPPLLPSSHLPVRLYNYQCDTNALDSLWRLLVSLSGSSCFSDTGDGEQPSYQRFFLVLGRLKSVTLWLVKLLLVLPLGALIIGCLCLGWCFHWPKCGCSNI